MNKILNWFIVSSANPDETSMTLKSLLVAGAGSIVNNLQALGLNASISSYTNEVGHATAVVGIVLAAIGFARKVFLTANQAVTPLKG